MAATFGRLRRVCCDFGADGDDGETGAGRKPE